MEAFLREHDGGRGWDGFLAFSQGGIMASALLAMQQKGKALQGLPPMRVAIVVASMASRSDQHRPFFSLPVRVPSVHVYGEKDPLKRGSVALAGLYEDPLVVVHPDGHKIPRLSGADLANVRRRLAAVAADLPSRKSSLTASL